MIQWTDSMYEFLRNNFQNMEDKEIAEFFTNVCGVPVNVRMVEHARARLGLTKWKIGSGQEGRPVHPKLREAWVRAKGPPGESG
jgi:hypothetical protein